MAVSRSWGYVTFASFAVLCEHCANVSLFLERIPFALSSQRTAKLTKKLISSVAGKEELDLRSFFSSYERLCPESF